MSTNSNCFFDEVEPGQWYYVLEDYNAPKNAWDWLDYAFAYGPFATFEEARKHLDDNHANPGGYDEHPWHEGKKAPTGQLATLIAEAEAPRRYRPFPRLTGHW